MYPAAQRFGGAIPVADARSSEGALVLDANKVILGRHFNEVLNEGRLDVVDEPMPTATSWMLPSRQRARSRHTEKPAGATA